ncbi:hypothetical protein [Kineococcus sp. SYSU DK018]|uniref:hypothetical protein n=1 Tax=Kineococcus sp. SYSU DK018 TaxID=3383139 RepID=UPI003D7C6796
MQRNGERHVEGDGERTRLLAGVEGVELRLDPRRDTSLVLDAHLGREQLFVPDVPAHPRAGRAVVEACGTVPAVWQPVLLRDFAAAAAAQLREVDTLARWGGEEFCWPCPAATPSARSPSPRCTAASSRAATPPWRPDPRPAGRPGRCRAEPGTHP